MNHRLEPFGSTRLDFKRLRRLGVWLPVVALGLLFGFVVSLTVYLHHVISPSIHWSIHWLIYLLVMGVITGGAYLFSHFVFRIVQQKEQEILRRNQELSALNAIGAVINESLHLDEILDRTLDKVLEVTGAEAGEIFLWDEGDKELVLRTFRGLFPEAFQEIQRFKRGEGLPGRIAQTGKAVVVHDLPGDQRFLRGRVIEAGFRSFAGVPLNSQGKVVGVMGIATLNPGRFTLEDGELLPILGNQIGVAIENARLYAQLKEMAMLEERQRIAREMHDGLAQELGYLYLKIGELEAIPPACPLQSACPRQREIHFLKKMAAKMYEEVRQAIFDLKTMVSPSPGLIPTLTEYLHEFSEQTGIAVELKIADKGVIRFSPQVEVQLIRIVQEALANVRKHAQAKSAWVIFDTEKGRAKVTIQDDGLGFDLEEVTKLSRASFGLQTMRERAESVGGMFEVESQRGKGTDVIVRFPGGGKEALSWRP